MNEAIDHPAVNAETRAYWEGARDGRLLIKGCNACGEKHFYPRAQCPYCRSLDTEWIESSGRGVIYSWTVMRRMDPPLAVAYVTLEEGVTMFTNIVECDLDALAVGQEVAVTFEEKADGLTVPVFKPA
ncbi:MAG: OB-fold domain-containing protein [Pseudomonadota bacterium]|nr:OB-fold domain-containing protein [Pseudomonadota bacterium]